MSVNCSYVSSCLYFIFEYVATIIWSCWSYYVPHCFRCVPSDFAPTHVNVVELNWVVLTGSSGDVDEISGTSSDRSPPSFFEVDQGNVSFSSVFYRVWCEGPTFSGCEARHSGSLVLMLCCH